MTPGEAIETLRGLDRRILALFGDLQTREETEVALGVGIGPIALSHTFAIPDDDEIARLDMELTVVGEELVELGRVMRLDIVPDNRQEPSRWQSDKAYGVVERRANQIRGQIRQAFESLTSAHGDLEAAPLADDTEVEDVEVPRSRWQRSPLARALLPGIPVFALLGMLFWHNHKKDREALEQACAHPSPCAGDVPQAFEIERREGERAASQWSYMVTRKTADCSRVVESYFTEAGSFDFRGSLDDPDPAKREAFAKKRARVREHHVVRSQGIDCTDL